MIITLPSLASLHTTPFIFLIRLSVARKSNKYRWGATSPHVYSFKFTILVFPVAEEADDSCSRRHHIPQPARPSVKKSRRKHQNWEKKVCVQISAFASMLVVLEEGAALLLVLASGTIVMHGMNQYPLSKGWSSRVCDLGLNRDDCFMRSDRDLSVGVICVRNLSLDTGGSGARISMGRLSRDIVPVAWGSVGRFVGRDFDKSCAFGSVVWDFWELLSFRTAFLFPRTLAETVEFACTVCRFEDFSFRGESDGPSGAILKWRLTGETLGLGLGTEEGIRVISVSGSYSVLSRANFLGWRAESGTNERSTWIRSSTVVLSDSSSCCESGITSSGVSHVDDSS